MLAGTCGGLALIPILHRVSETLSGHHGSCHIEVLSIILTAAAILVFVGLVAHTKASIVRKYPPVQAFRKGIAAHHFGRNVLPLRRTRGSVHFRLAMKGFLGNLKQNIGLTICIAVSSLAAMGGMMTADLFGSDLKAAMQLTGTEIPDLTVAVVRSANAGEIAEKISRMDGVKRVHTGSFSLDISEWHTIYAFDRSDVLIPISYESFSECENIRATAGRLPVHDNEIALTRIFALKRGLKVGDDLTLEYNGIKKNFLICGMVASLTNGGMNIYLTEQAFKRLDPVYRLTAVEIYLEDGTDQEAFQNILMQTYGRSVADTRRTTGTGETAADRLRAAADQKIAEYLANHGADHIEYAIQIGDQVISGSSDSFVIKNVQNLGHILQTQIGGAFRSISQTAWALMAMSALVAMIIIIALMEQTIRRQRKELGILLGLGYTTKELMLQLAMRIMPAAILAVILGTVSAAAIFNGFMKIVVGGSEINFPLLLAAAVMMILFCFGCAYIGAGRIKKISVTELMTE